MVRNIRKHSRTVLTAALAALGALVLVILIFTIPLTPPPHELPLLTLEETDTTEDFLMREYREPADYLVEILEQNKRVYWGINPWDANSFTFLTYLFPVLGKQNTRLELPFIQEQDRNTLQKLLDEDVFSREKASELLFRANPFWGYQEYLDFLAALHRYNYQNRETRKTIPVVGDDSTTEMIIRSAWNKEAIPEEAVFICPHTGWNSYPWDGLFEMVLGRIPAVKRISLMEMTKITGLMEKLNRETDRIPPGDFYLFSFPLSAMKSLTPLDSFINEENKDEAVARWKTLNSRAREAYPTFPLFPEMKKRSAEKTAEQLNKLIEEEAEKAEILFSRFKKNP